MLCSEALTLKHGVKKQCQELGSRKDLWNVCAIQRLNTEKSQRNLTNLCQFRTYSQTFYGLLSCKKEINDLALSRSSMSKCVGFLSRDLY